MIKQADSLDIDEQDSLIEEHHRIMAQARADVDARYAELARARTVEEAWLAVGIRARYSDEEWQNLSDDAAAARVAEDFVRGKLPTVTTAKAGHQKKKPRENSVKNMVQKYALQKWGNSTNKVEIAFMEREIKEKAPFKQRILKSNQKPYSSSQIKKWLRELNLHDPEGGRKKSLSSV